MSDENKAPRNSPMTLTLNGHNVDALEDYLIARARMWKVAAGQADEIYSGEARDAVNLTGASIADRLVRAAKDVGLTGSLADALLNENGAMAECAAITNSKLHDDS